MGFSFLHRRVHTANSACGDPSPFPNAALRAALRVLAVLGVLASATDVPTAGRFGRVLLPLLAAPVAVLAFPVPLAVAFRSRTMRASGPGVSLRLLEASPETEALYEELHREIEAVARGLWGGREIPCLAPLPHPGGEGLPPGSCSDLWIEGEAELPGGLSFSERGPCFREMALGGCPSAQHSYGLLLWSGFAEPLVPRDPEASALFHAAAARQHHLDAIAVLGGCLRTGTGIPQRTKKQTKQQRKAHRKQQEALGLRLIRFSAEAGNPSGTNKRAALLEAAGDERGAVDLCEACLASGRASALLLFNLGWSCRHGIGVDRKDPSRGVALWKEAASMAPDEGSEEAAWHLCSEFAREDPAEAEKWRRLSDELGFRE